MRGRGWDGRTSRLLPALLVWFSISLPAVYAEQTTGPAGMGGGGRAVASEATGQLGDLWRQAMAEFNPEQLSQLVPTLREAAVHLSQNWAEQQELIRRMQSAAEEARASIRKRLELGEQERDLIVSGVETELGDFLSNAQVQLVMAAAFHGVSRGHSEEGHPMTMGMDRVAQMPSMQAMEEMGMRLAAAALQLNGGYQAISLDELLRELDPARP